MLKRTCRPGYTKKMARLDHLLSGRAGIYLRDAAQALVLKHKQQLNGATGAPKSTVRKKAPRGT